jgi:hypothetical protein
MIWRVMSWAGARFGLVSHYLRRAPALDTHAGSAGTPIPAIEESCHSPVSTLSDADMRRLAVGVMLAAVDGDENGIRRALTGLTVSDLVDLAGELAGLGTAVWRTRGASREALRDSLQVYALQLAVELPSRPQRGCSARTRTSHVISGAPPTPNPSRDLQAIYGNSGAPSIGCPQHRRLVILCNVTAHHTPFYKASHRRTRIAA